MGARVFTGAAVIILISIFAGQPAGAHDPTLGWNTFLGTSGYDSGISVAVDGLGNVYVVGNSEATWGTPLVPHSGSNDGYVAKLSATGILLWNTFLDGWVTGNSHGVAVDGSGNVYVVGTAFGPASTGGTVVKLDSSGAQVWLTGVPPEFGPSVAVDGSGNVYVAGESGSSWGLPVNAFAGDIDACVAKLNSAGELQWHTYLGSAGQDRDNRVAVDAAGNVYAGGYSDATWGLPLIPFSGNDDAFVARLNSSGALQWNTFIGSGSWDYLGSILTDPSGDIVISGHSAAAWGAPVNPHTGSYDAFVAKLSGAGAVLWNTFLGSSTGDYGRSVALDEKGGIYVAGMSMDTWGTPLDPFIEFFDAFIANLDSAGALRWHTFLGTGDDDGKDVALDARGNAYVAGDSKAAWGAPVRAHSGFYDAFVAKFQTYYRNDLVLDFGSATGVWANYDDDPDTWRMIHGFSPGSMTVAGLDCLDGQEVILDFGSGTGVWANYNDDPVSWRLLHDLPVESMASGNLDGRDGRDVILDFGSAAGVWVNYNDDPAHWRKIHASSPGSMAVGNLDNRHGHDVVLDFGSAGVWANYNDNPATWRRIHASSPELMAVGNLDNNGKDEVVFDFGSAGVWANYNDDPAAWRRIHPGSPELLLIANLDNSGKDEVVMDFGSPGVWVNYNDSPSSWRKIHGTSPENMACGDLDSNGTDDVVLDFGSGTGLWVNYNDAPLSWRRIHQSSPEGMATGDLEDD